jgi:hypothetical protein
MPEDTPAIKATVVRPFVIRSPRRSGGPPTTAAPLEAIDKIEGDRQKMFKIIF